MKYSKYIPKDSFIGQYMEYMSVLETAESYDFWTAIWAIGVASGRSVFVNRPNSPIYLNWYIVLAAESGTTRKSTAIREIQSIIGTGARSITGKTTPESLELMLHQQTLERGTAHAYISSSELVTVLGKEGYMAAMPGLLTDLYDCSDIRTSPGNLKTGVIEHKEVFVNFLSASTPTWLVTAINPAVIEGGFTSRVMFVVDDNRKRAIPWPEPREIDATATLREQLIEIIEAAREYPKIPISAGALKKFTKWYRSKPVHNEAFLNSFEAREDDHVLKMAACLCINDGKLEIQTMHITAAIAIIDDVKKKAFSLFGGGFSEKARISGAVDKVRAILLKVGTDGISHTDMSRRVQRNLDAKELKLLMSIMHEAGFIQIFQYKKGRFYRATRSLEGLSVTTQVLEKLNATD